MTALARVTSRWVAIVDRMADAPRWIDAPWAVLGVAGYVLSWIFESGPPYWFGGLSMLALMIRLQVTSRRLHLRTSALTPLAERAVDWLYEIRQKRLTKKP